MEKRYQYILGTLTACFTFLLVLVSLLYLSCLDEAKRIKNEKLKIDKEMRSLNEKEQEKAEQRVSIPKGEENYTYVFND